MRSASFSEVVWMLTQEPHPSGLLHKGIVMTPELIALIMWNPSPPYLSGFSRSMDGVIGFSFFLM
jgi:hypothetical protein